MKLYKLTDENMKTHGGCQWVLGEQRTASGIGDLCTDGWLHAYEHPLIAVLLNPIHANFDHPRLFAAKGKVGLRDGRLKCGCTSLTLVSEIPLPVVTTAQRVRFAILCAQAVIGDKCPAWSVWAERWLSGEDRSAARAQAAEAARAVAEAARAVAEWAAEWSAQAAEWSAQAAEWSAQAAWSAEAAARAAAEAARAGRTLDLIALAKRAGAEERP